MATGVGRFENDSTSTPGSKKQEEEAEEEEEEEEAEEEEDEEEEAGEITAEGARARDQRHHSCTLSRLVQRGDQTR
ncbi:unnamed protein product [Diplocarpon coronariae]